MADVVYGVKHGTSSTAGQGTLTQRLAYAYDGFGRLTTRTLSAISKSTGYTYVTNGTNGRTTVVDSMTNGSETLSYVYDDNGNITEYRKGGSLQEKYYYDTLNQLVRVDSVVQNETIVYAYDGNGNILSKSEYAYTTGTPSGTPAVTAYTYGSSGWKDKLTAYDGQSITYDGLGNPLTYRGMTFSWQHGRELASVTLGGATTAYTYDETGSRVQKVSNGITTTYHVVDGTLMEEVRNDGRTLTYLLDENGTKYGVIYNGDYYYYFFNLQGDVIGLYNSSGTIVARYVYDVWGKLLAVTDESGNAITDMSNIANLNPIRYRGYYYDVETGFYYLQSRYYAPTVGRFINADGQLNPGIGGYNLFSYCENNPVNKSDPYGYACSHEAGTGMTFITPEKTILILNNRKPGKTPNNSWPKLPRNLAGRNPKWNPNGYWEGANGGRYTWDNHSHGTGVDRGNGSQDGHWDDEVSGNRWDRKGDPIKQTFSNDYSNKTILDKISDMTGLTGTVLIIFFFVSEASRLFPPRNLIPIP